MKEAWKARREGCMDGRTDRWTNGRTDKRTDGRTDGWMNEYLLLLLQLETDNIPPELRKDL